VGNDRWAPVTPAHTHTHTHTHTVHTVLHVTDHAPFPYFFSK